MLQFARGPWTMDYEWNARSLLPIVAVVLIALISWLVLANKKCADGVAAERPEYDLPYSTDYSQFPSLPMRFRVEAKRDSEENLTVTAKQLCYMASVHGVLPPDGVAVLNQNYKKATANWYTKDIGIPKYFILALYQVREDLFSGEKVVDENVAQLLDKIFESRKQISTYGNGYSVMLYSLLYAKLAKEFPGKLKSYETVLSEDYVAKMKEKIATRFELSDRHHGEGFHTDRSFIYHSNVPYSSSYLTVLIEDFALIKKYDLAPLNEHNVDVVVDSFVANVYGSYVHVLSGGRAISRPRMLHSVYEAAQNVNFLKPDSVNGRDLNNMQHAVAATYHVDRLIDYGASGFTNEGRVVLKPVEGIYAWYGDNYDNYIIYGSAYDTEQETVDCPNDGDLMIKNSNYGQAFAFGDERFDRWYRAVNDRAWGSSDDVTCFQPGFWDAEQPSVYLSGALYWQRHVELDSSVWLQNRKLVTDAVGWLTNYAETIDGNIQVVFRYVELSDGKNVLIYYVIDRWAQGMTVHLTTGRDTNARHLDSVSLTSVYSDKQITCGLNEAGDLCGVYSSLRPRLIHCATGEMNIELDNRHAYMNTCNVTTAVRYGEDGVGACSAFVTTRPDHTIPSYGFKDGIFTYDNGQSKFTLKQLGDRQTEHVFDKGDTILTACVILERDNGSKCFIYVNPPGRQLKGAEGAGTSTPTEIDGIKVTVDDALRVYAYL